MSIVIAWFVASIVVAIIAASRGRNSFGWFLLALLISPLIAGILVLALGSKSEAGRRCPDCAETVRAEARKCRHCGAALEPMSAPKIDDLPEGNAARGYAYLAALLVALIAAALAYCSN